MNELWPGINDRESPPLQPEWEGHKDAPYCPACSNRRKDAHNNTYKVLLQHREGDFFWCVVCNTKYVRCYLDNRFVGVKAIGKGGIEVKEQYRKWYKDWPEDMRCPYCWKSERVAVLLMWEDHPYQLRCMRCHKTYNPEYLKRRMKKMSEQENEGNYAIIRPGSSSGHSPSSRFRTQTGATAAAVKLAEDNIRLTLEVVKIVARVSCKPKATVTRVR